MATYQPYVTMNSCCSPIIPECVDCPIVVSCDTNLVIHPGQLRYCPDNAKYYYNSFGQTKCLNPSWGLGLGIDGNCEVKVKLGGCGGLVFDEFGAIVIDCEPLVDCCSLVTRDQLNTVLDIIYSKLPKNCAGGLLSSADRVFEVGSLRDAADVALACNAKVWTTTTLLKCDGTPLLTTDRVVTDCTPVVAPISTRVTNPSQYIGAGICLPIGPGTYVNGVAIMRMRDFVSEVGSITVPGGSNPPAHLAFTYTNASAVTELIEATLMGAGNVYYGALNAAVGFTYNIGETLNINMPDMLFQTNNPGAIRQTVEVKGLNSRGGDGGTSVYHEESVGGATFTKLLAPGATVNLYSQAWITLYDTAPLPAGLTVIHATMAMRVRVTSNGAYL